MAATGETLGRCGNKRNIANANMMAEIVNSFARMAGNLRINNGANLTTETAAGSNHQQLSTGIIPLLYVVLTALIELI
jgi:hypothetical protein